MTAKYCGVGSFQQVANVWKFCWVEVDKWVK